MQARRLSCPKCGDWRIDRYGVGTKFEEAHCRSCGYIVYLGLARERRNTRTHSAEVSGD